MMMVFMVVDRSDQWKLHSGPMVEEISAVISIPET